MVRSLVLAFPILSLAACSQSGLRDLSDSPFLADDGEVIDGEFVIGADVPESYARSLGLRKVDFDAVLGAGLYEAETDGVDLWTLSVALKQDLSPDLLVEPNRPRLTQRTMNDPYRSLQWNLDQLDMNAAWDRSTGAGVTVAVIDTGVSSKGSDAPKNLKKGWDFIANDADPNDENGHGTHVAGTVAQRSDNGVGCSGVAPDATVLAVRVLDRYGGGSSYGVAQGITYAVDNGADVINLSLGSPSSTSLEQQAIADAIARDVVVVAASGNEGRSSVSYPGAYTGVIAVGATGADGRVPNYSNGGSALDVVAPGGDLGKDVNRDGYADGVLQQTLAGFEFYEGTSMASPHVAAIVALLLADGARPDDVRDLLVSTASNNGKFDTWSGYGLVDPVAALDALGGGGSGGGGTTTPPPTTDTVAPVISAVSGSRSGTRLDLWWTTDEPATTEIEFDGYGRFAGSGGLTTEHAMSFTVGSTSSYTFTVIAVDAAGNEGKNGKWVTNP